MFRIPGVDSWTVDDFFENFGPPKKLSQGDLFIEHGYEILPKSKHVPEYLIPSPDVPREILSLCFNSPDIQIM